MEAIRLAKRLMIPVNTMQQAYMIFKEFATIPANATVPEGAAGGYVAFGRLTRSQLDGVLKALEMSSDSEDMTALIESAFKIVGRIASPTDRRGSSKNGGDNIAMTFKQFATWYASNIFSLDFNVDPKEQKRRELASKLGIAV